MEEKKTYNKQEKKDLLLSFGESLDDQSLRILEKLRDSKKDLNKLLAKAWKYIKP